MSKPITCPRCHGPATMIDRAPRGESGDVVRCAKEETCAALADAARDLEQAHASVADAAQEFVRNVGKVKPVGSGGPASIKIEAHLYIDLQAAVRDWKEAGQALHDLSVKHAA